MNKIEGSFVLSKFENVFLQDISLLSLPGSFLFLLLLLAFLFVGKHPFCVAAFRRLFCRLLLLRCNTGMNVLHPTTLPFPFPSYDDGDNKKCIKFHFSLAFFSGEMTFVQYISATKGPPLPPPKKGLNFLLFCVTVTSPGRGG